MIHMKIDQEYCYGLELDIAERGYRPAGSALVPVRLFQLQERNG